MTIRDDALKDLSRRRLVRLPEGALVYRYVWYWRIWKSFTNWVAK